MATKLIVIITLCALPVLLVLFAWRVANKQDEPVCRTILAIVTALTTLSSVLTAMILTNIAFMKPVPDVPESPLMKKARLERVVFNKRYGR